jgi:TRAP-type C4-dicarboxylate transport system substrate-binding protein
MSKQKPHEGKAKIYEGNTEGYEVHDAAPLRPDNVSQAYWDRLPPDEQRALYEHEVKREAEMAEWEVIYAERRKARLVEKAAPDLLAALRRIEAIAHYFGSIKGHTDEVTQAFNGIMEEASEAIAKAKGEEA